MLAERGPSTEIETEVATFAAAAFGRAFTSSEFDQFLDLLSADIEFEVPSVMQATVPKLARARTRFAVTSRRRPASTPSSRSI